jgi:hypothetical protein
MGSTFKKISCLLTVLFTFALAPIASASPENDRVYQFETLSWLKATDNMDGIFSEYLDEQFNHYFTKQSRFAIKPLKGLNEVLGNAKARYQELVQQAEILKKISQKYQVECLIRSRVYKEGETYRFVFEWVYAPKGDVVTSIEFRFMDPGHENGIQGSELPKAIEKALDDLIRKLPFIGQVTGVEGSNITVSVGRNQGVHPRDTVTLYSLQSVRRHPVLKTVEEWRWQPVGRAQVEQVEESMSFAKVTETEPGVNVIRMQKVREIIPAPVEYPAESPEAHGFIAKSGWIAANGGIGIYSREVGAPTGATTPARGGSGLLENFELDAQVWLNSRYIAQGSYLGSLFKYSPTDLTTGSAMGTSYSGSETQSRLALGYSLFPMKNLFDPIAWVHAGYKSTSYYLPVSADLTANNFASALFIGVGGSFPIRNRWSAQMDLDLGVIRTAASDGLSMGDASGSSDLNFRLATRYQLDPHLFFRVLFNISSVSMDFTGGQTVTQKVFSLSPSFMYYF